MITINYRDVRTGDEWTKQFSTYDEILEYDEGLNTDYIESDMSEELFEVVFG